MRIILDSIFMGGTMSVKQSEQVVYKKYFNSFTRTYDRVKNIESGAAQIRFGGPFGKWKTLNLGNDSVICVRMRNYFKILVALMLLSFIASSSLAIAWVDWMLVAFGGLFLLLIVFSLFDSRFIYRIDEV